MKPVIRFKSQLLYRKSYRPQRALRIRPIRLNFVFRPVHRFGIKPQLAVEGKIHENRFIAGP